MLRNWTFEDFVAMCDRPQTCAEEEAMWNDLRKLYLFGPERWPVRVRTDAPTEDEHMCNQAPRGLEPES
jgi:hypothetical protein